MSFYSPFKTNLQRETWPTIQALVPSHERIVHPHDLLLSIANGTGATNSNRNTTGKGYWQTRRVQPGSSSGCGTRPGTILPGASPGARPGSSECLGTPSGSSRDYQQSPPNPCGS